MLSLGSRCRVEAFCYEELRRFYFCFILLAAKFFPLKLLTAGDIAARGGSFGGRTLAAEAPLFLGIKFCVVFVIAA